MDKCRSRELRTEDTEPQMLCSKHMESLKALLARLSLQQWEGEHEKPSKGTELDSWQYSWVRTDKGKTRSAAMNGIDMRKKQQGWTVGRLWKIKGEQKNNGACK